MTTTTTAARDQRRLGRQKRRGTAGGAPTATTAPPDSVLERARQVSPGAAALAGAAVGVLTGVLVGRETRKRGNEIVGDVAVHLLNKFELLTIRLQVRQARRGGPAKIDVHRVQRGVSSRAAAAG